MRYRVSHPRALAALLLVAGLAGAAMAGYPVRRSETAENSPADAPFAEPRTLVLPNGVRVGLPAGYEANRVTGILPDGSTGVVLEITNGPPSEPLSVAQWDISGARPAAVKWEVRPQDEGTFKKMDSEMVAPPPAVRPTVPRPGEVWVVAPDLPRPPTPTLAPFSPGDDLSVPYDREREVGVRGDKVIHLPPGFTFTTVIADYPDGSNTIFFRVARDIPDSELPVATVVFWDAEAGVIERSKVAPADDAIVRRLMAEIADAYK